MDWFDNLKERLFGEAVQRTGRLHHAPLVRTPAFEARHAQWLAFGEGRKQLGELHDLLDQEKRTGDTPRLHLFSDAKATGMQLRRPAHWPADSLHHLLDAFRQQVLGLGYRVHMSDLRISVQGEHRERHYLKPETDTTGTGELVDQRYGNILLEAWGPDDGAEYLKVLATVYSDRLYSPALSGMELLSSLTTGRGLPLS
ncbi:MAG: hypothetical protein WEC15_03700 [Flavobacteriales bacterium]